MFFFLVTENCNIPHTSIKGTIASVIRLKNKTNSDDHLFCTFRFGKLPKHLGGKVGNNKVWDKSEAFRQVFAGHQRSFAHEIRQEILQH